MNQNDSCFLALQVLHASFDLLDGAVLGAGSGQVGQLVQALLPLADVPVQAFGQRIEPIGDLVLGAYARHRVDGGRYVEAITMEQLLTVPAVKRNPRTISAIRRKSNLQLHTGRQHDRPEAQRVWTDGRHQEIGRAHV